MSPARWRRVRLAGGVGLLALLVWRVGTGPFLDGVRRVDPGTLLIGAGLALASTVCCAWRWTLVARGLGTALPLRTAVAAYYRSQLLNTVLPAGVVGDVDRGLRHGLGAVVCERAAGQAVQVAAALVVLVLVPSPLRSSVPALVAATAVACVVAVVLVRARPGGGDSAGARALRHVRRTVRDGLGPAWPGVVVASLLAVVGHVAGFEVAARAAGVRASPGELLPLALLVLLAMAVPFNVAGWGPREGVAAWAFGAAGLGAGEGVSVAVVYGVMVLVASLPGALVLAADWLRHRPRAGGPSAVPEPVTAVVVHG